MSGQYHRSHRWAWFLERPGYVRFMVREFTCFFVAGYLIVLLVTLGRLGGGEAAFAEWLGAVSGPGWMAAHIVALIAAVWHSVTWFAVVPQAMPIYLGEKRLPAPLAAVAMGYGPWLTVTAAIVWWVLR
jgi:fumarate reductase subunit C